MRVCIDAGHGGGDSGAVSAGVREAAVAWQIAHAAALHLRAIWCDVRETRPALFDGDTLRVDLGRRRKVADGCELLVSVHCNASNNATANGAEAYVPDGASPTSRLVAGMCLEACRGLGFTLRSHDGTALGAVRLEGMSQHPRLAILHLTRHAALIEVGFITHSGDRARMTGSFANIGVKLADAIDAGLAKAKQYAEEVEPPKPLMGATKPSDDEPPEGWV